MGLAETNFQALRKTQKDFQISRKEPKLINQQFDFSGVQNRNKTNKESQKNLGNVYLEPQPTLLGYHDDTWPWRVPVKPPGNTSLTTQPLQVLYIVYQLAPQLEVGEISAKHTITWKQILKPELGSTTLQGQQKISHFQRKPSVIQVYDFLPTLFTLG